MKVTLTAIVVLSLGLTSCAQIGSVFKSIKVSGIRDATPKYEPYVDSANDPYRVLGKTYVPLQSEVGYREQGVASWYGKKFHGKPTSIGETYDMYQMTAAHKTLPLPCYVSVTNLENKKKITVRVNDRGPFIDDRIIDLSYAAALKLDLVGPGTGPVLVEAIPVDGRPIPKKKKNATYHLSLGVFREKDNATRLRAEMRDQGIKKVKIKKKKVNFTTYYQVLLGPIKSLKDLNFFIQEVSASMVEEPVVITD